MNLDRPPAAPRPQWETARSAAGRIRRGLAAWCVLLALSVVQAGGEGPAIEVGTPFLQNYDYQEYGAHPQNWSIVQDAGGIMYFGNSDGVLIYDAVGWQVLEVANRSIVRSLAVDSRGTVFVGAVGEIGYLRTDAQGTQTYESLMDSLPEDDRDFADVWRTLSVGDDIFFWARDLLFRWRDQRFTIWRIDRGQTMPHVIDGKLYYNHADSGLMVLTGNEFEPVPGGGGLAAIRLVMMLDAGAGTLLLGTRDGRLFTLSLAAEGVAGGSSGAPRPDRFTTEADGILRTHKLYTGTGLPDGTYALTTMTGGAVVIGRRGKLRHRLDRARGLPDDSVWWPYADRQGGLWLGLNRGITRAEISSPITVFDRLAGIDGTVETIARHQGRLFVGTSLGLFGYANGRFEPLPGIQGPCWSLLSYPSVTGETSLLVGAKDGVFELRAGELHQIRDSSNSYLLYRSRVSPAWVFAGEAGGLAAIRYQPGGWVDAGDVTEIRQEVRSIAEDQAGRLWLGTHFDGVLRVRLGLGGEKIEVEELERFGTDQGLPGLKSIKLHPREGEILAATGDGLWRFDPTTERFEPSELLGPEHTRGGTGILRMAPDPRGNLWLSRIDQAGPAIADLRPDGSYEIRDLPFRRLPRGLWYAVYPEPGGVTWFGGTEGLFRYDDSIAVATDPDFPTLLRGVTRTDGSPLYGGTSVTAPAKDVTREAPLPFEENSLVFQFSAPSFDNEDANTFRYQLQGYDADWSRWVNDTKKEYTNLPEGDYLFRVQARNVYGAHGTVAEYRFTVSPPWYRTPAFILVMLVALGALLWGVHRALVARNLRSQRLVAEREEAVNREQLIAQLEATNDELERFTYTVSHDLKAPIVTIKGFLGYLKKDAEAGDAARLHQDIDRIEAAAEKMRLLVDDLLELSRVGRQANPPEEVPMSDLLNGALELLAGPLRERRIEVVIAPELPTVVGDRARLVEVLQNLIENAVKYMGEQASPRIEVGRRATSPGDEHLFYVSDNGIGIESQYHDQVFGLFERLEAETEGTGVGLALVKRILDVHGGRVWVESEGRGQGSTFCFTLPGPDLGDSRAKRRS